MELKAGVLDAIGLEIALKTGNKVRRECHFWFSTGDAVELFETENGRLVSVAVYLEVLWVREIDQAEELRVREAQAKS